MRPTRDEEFRVYVIARHSDLLRTAVLLTAGDRHLAEDLVQTTLTRLYVSWPVFQKADNPVAYARRALVNALLDEKKRPWRRREQSVPILPEPAVAGLGGNPRVELLHQALAELPARMRAAVVLRYFHDLSVADTAAALGCRPGTVKSQTARALDRLRAVLDTALPDPPGHLSTEVHPERPLLPLAPPTPLRRSS
jgi:RNA polymerase sigma-70 factor (sigma-E family)